jgi:2-amino-4-hydroxy-6-hydroxymethyldihydropteridine diphosphokinase
VRAIVSLGSNLGEREENLNRAISALSNLPETELLARSPFIETEGIDVPEEFQSLKFINAVAVFETSLDAETFAASMHRIEDEQGRVRTVRNGPRIIDIDLIDFGGIKMNSPNLILPHPRAKERAFVTEPMISLDLNPSEIL